MTHWPDLDLTDFAPTMETLHLWSQISGKVKLAALPWLNQSWHVPLQLSATGLTTGLVTQDDLGFELAFDLVAGTLRITASDGAGATVRLAAGSIASFHAAVIEGLAAIGARVGVTPLPSEIEGAIPFAQDTRERIFDIAAARAWWHALIRTQHVFHRFRSRYVGKCSPIHLFWGSFDLAVTRFSGRPAPLVTRGGPNMSVAVAQDAYAEEQCGAGVWPGGGGVDGPTFYLEAWPEPGRLEEAQIGPRGARFDRSLGKWLLGYDVVRQAGDPDAALLDFLQSGYAAVAELGGWPRERLEREEGPLGRPPPVTSPLGRDR